MAAHSVWPGWGSERMSWERVSPLMKVIVSRESKACSTWGLTPEAVMVMVGGPLGVGEGAGVDGDGSPEEPQASARSARQKARGRQGIKRSLDAIVARGRLRALCARVSLS